MDNFFIFDNEKYEIFDHKYNQTKINERSVEIPIAHNYLNRFDKKNVLEIGNVTSHYFNSTHRIVDKYEKFKNVENIDIMNINENDRYDFILSISTFEHIGYWKNEIDHKKRIRAFDKIKKNLTPNGLILITLPFCFDLYDGVCFNQIKNNEFGFSKMKFMKKYFKDNKKDFIWKECEMETALDSKYSPKSYPYGTCATSVCFAFYHGK